MMFSLNLTNNIWSLICISFTQTLYSFSELLSNPKKSNTNPVVIPYNLTVSQHISHDMWRVPKWSGLQWRPASVLFQRRWKTHTLDLLLCLITSYSMATSKKKSMRLNFHIYIDLNYFGPRGLNKLQSGSRGVALFFSSFTGIWFNCIEVRRKREMGKTASGT